MSSICSSRLTAIGKSMIEQEPPLGLVSRLCKALEAEGVVYCHWKSNAAITRSARGDNDLDLLVRRADVQRFTEVLYRLKFKEARFPPERQVHSDRLLPPGILRNQKLGDPDPADRPGAADRAEYLFRLHQGTAQCQRAQGRPARCLEPGLYQGLLQCGTGRQATALRCRPLGDSRRLNRVFSAEVRRSVLRSAAVIRD